MLRAIKLRLYPNKDQEIYINKLLGSSRFVYNQCLNFKKTNYENSKINHNLTSLGKFFHNDLTKNPEFIWLQEHNTKILKQSIIDMLDAYSRFFKGSGFPKFKSKHDKQSCRFPIDAISKKQDFSKSKITLTKQLKDLKFKTSDKYINYLVKNQANIKSATLSKNKSNELYLSILVDGDLLKQLDKPKNFSIGIDLGIKDFVITSKGDKFENIKTIRNNQEKLSKLQKQHSRKKKGSKNKEKERLRLAKYHQKLVNIKENYLHKVSNTLLNENQVICMENLNVSGMLKNHKLARSIQELSLYRFETILKYKSNWYNHQVINIDRFYPSSKTCSDCGYINHELKLSDREWICPDCGVIHDRDLNAALNIEQEGLKIYLELYKNKIL
jgi:putative transposase